MKTEDKTNFIVSSPQNRTEIDRFLRFGRPRRRKSAPQLIQTSLISPNPSQPRRFFDPDSIASLADSIRQHGILHPLTVRPLPSGKYELIAGERRLRAAILLSLPEIPCVTIESDTGDAATLAILENLQRQDLNMFEQANAIASLIQTCNLTQEEVAARLSVSQSFVANKLRLLRYLPDERAQILSASLTERHARTLLRLPPDDRLGAIQAVIDRHYNVADTEAFVDRLLTAASPPPIFASSDHSDSALDHETRHFCKTISDELTSLRRSGVTVDSNRRETETAIEWLIRIPKC